MRLTGQIISAAKGVHRTLAPGFIESVYHSHSYIDHQIRLAELDVEKADKKPRIARTPRTCLSQVPDSCAARRLHDRGALCTSNLTLASSWMR